MFTDKVYNFSGEKQVFLTRTNKPVTPFGGMSLFCAFCNALGIKELLGRHLPFSVSSPNATNLADIILAFWAGVLAGARKFSQVSLFRKDIPLKLLFSLKRYPSTSTFTRFFAKFKNKLNRTFFPRLFLFCMSRLPVREDGYVIDLDSTINVRYGKQEGAKRGYNPKKPGRPSHHPLLAIVTKPDMIIHAQMRRGNIYSAKGTVQFIRQLTGNLPQSFKIKAFRGDSGFFDDRILSFFEKNGYRYAVYVKYYPTIQRVAKEGSFWREFAPGFEVKDTFFKADKWKGPRRLILIREIIEDEDFKRGKKLFDVPGYRFSAIITNMENEPEEVWRFYNKRADCENIIKDLKYSYGMDSFNVHNFWGTEAAFLLICFLFNIISFFQREILKKRITLNRMRNLILTCGAILGGASGKTVLRLSHSEKWYRKFSLLVRQVNNVKTNCIAVED